MGIYVDPGQKLRNDHDGRFSRVSGSSLRCLRRSEVQIRVAQPAMKHQYGAIDVG